MTANYTPNIGFPIPEPCADVRPLWRFPHTCECGVLVELHSEQGWRDYFERYALACEREMIAAQKRADHLQFAAFNYRAVGERPPETIRATNDWAVPTNDGRTE